MKKLILILTLFLTIGAQAQEKNYDTYKSARNNFIAGYIFTGIAMYAYTEDFENRTNRNGETGLTMSNKEYLAIGSGIVAVILFSNAYSEFKVAETNRIKLQTNLTSFKLTYSIGRGK